MAAPPVVFCRQQNGLAGWARPSYRGPMDPVEPDDARTQRPTPEPLWREVLGARLRHLRRERALTLADVAERSGISVQYLSEVERGLKEPSSEIIAAVVGALDTSLEEVTGLVSLDLSTVAPLPVRQSTGPAVTPQQYRGPVALAA